MEEDIKILLDFIKYIRFDEEKHYTMDKYYTAIENSVEHMQNLIKENKEQEKMIDLMAQYIDFDKMDFNCSNLCVHDGCIEECVIKYFKKQAKELI